MEAAGIALRLLIYLQSAMLLGIILFAAPWNRHSGRVAAVLAWTGVVLTAAHILLLARTFSGNGAWFDIAMIGMLITDTPTGWAAISRGIALAAVALAIGAAAPRNLVGAIAIAGVATLAWNGHGNMTEGGIGWVHLITNALHLVAGLGWIGAVAAFLSTTAMRDAGSPRLAARLRGFAATGSAMVAILVATGLVNMLFIVGWDALPAVPTTQYGRLLLVKLGLFAAMLAVAAANRWWLVPRLAIFEGQAALRLSLATEMALGAGVLALVAWFGTLDPAT